ncbi:MAG: hypothetical protein R3C59_09455 [Planctomycetaceae bacterium]
MRPLLMIFSSVFLMASAAPAEAGIGTLLSKTISAISSKAQQVFQKTASRAVNKAGSQSAGKIASRTASGTAAHVAGKAAMAASAKAAEKGSRVATSAANTVMKNLGVSGASALTRLKPESAVKLAEMSSVLARSPHRTEWVHAIGKYGGKCVDFLYEHRGGLAVGTVATAALLRPEDFFRSVGGVAEAGVSAAGEFVAQPLINATAEHVVGPAAKEAAAAVPWKFVVGNITMIVLVLLGFALWRGRPSGPPSG